MERNVGIAQLLRRRGAGELSREDFFRCLNDLKASTPTTRSSEGVDLQASPRLPHQALEAAPGRSGETRTPRTRPFSSPGSRSSGSSFALRNELWDLQRSRRLEHMREQRDRQELKECSFQPAARAARGAKRSGDASSMSPVSQSALLRRLTTPSSPGARARQRLEVWKAEREAMEGECTFSPNTISSSRSFQVVRAGMTARTPEKVDSARSARNRSQLEPSFSPATNPVPARMRSAKAYLQQSVFRRLSQPVTPRRERASEVPSFVSRSPLSRCSSAPTVGDESLLRFLRRQNFCEEVRQNRLGQLEAAVAPPLRPVLCERSLQMTARGRRTSSPRRRVISPAEKECRFKPHITLLARQREPRGSVELGPKDQRRREERARRRLEEKARKEAKVSAGYFKPSVNSYENVGSRIRILEEPETYLDRVSRTRARALQVIRNQCKEDYPFQPKVQAAPALVQRMARSHRTLKEVREKENRSKVPARPAWQPSTLLD